MHLERLIKIKRQRLHDDLCTSDNMAKFGFSDEDLMTFHLDH